MILIENLWLSLLFGKSEKGVLPPFILYSELFAPFSVNIISVGESPIL